MIDVKSLLNNFDSVSEKLQIKKVSSDILLALKDAAQNYKKTKQNLESLQAEQNKQSKLFGEKAKEGKEALEVLKSQLDGLKKEIATLNQELKAKEEILENLLFGIPNIPDEKTPKGDDENDNIELKKVLKPKEFTFKPKEHWELAQENGWIDFERGVKLAKSRFSVLRGMGARLNRALINFMLDYNQKAGFEMVVTPVIVNEKMLFGTGQLPKFEEDMFKIDGNTDPLLIGEEVKKQDFYLISTSEITLTNLYHDEIIPAQDLPILLTAQTPCFRKEAGSAGRDTRGMIRQHQFDKVELVAITKPEQSDEIHQKMIDTASGILEALGLPHRMVQLCGGDLGFSASNTVDIEVWLPGQNCYREISSVSNTRDFQARRAKIRYKEDKKNALVHTLNGSSLAVGRTLIAIMENYQKEDGSIEIPEALKSYL
ncbi:serine--tRNA ligase [Helicobacter sp. faydin-H20]|uniref:serine--tRNA ligase n=1 Tax=Helicobacter anatolicus TaxID=2905874 RepID=UPI001E5152B6|nr:serine--tRNA ligase [Helicobacter anatolicus]MCE3037304.1 serine--tRNA ligase [Helicobacter anatolicus]